jgi:hypothetical protein
MVAVLAVVTVWAASLVLAMLFVRGATRKASPHHHHTRSCSLVHSVAERRHLVRTPAA